MTQTLSFKYALAPTSRQHQALSSHVGASRFAYNWSLQHVLDNWQKVKTDSSVSYVSTSAYSLRNQLNAVKNDVAPWWRENSKEAFASGTANASQAFANWFKGRKKSQKTGFPKFKTRHDDSQLGVTFTTGPLRLEKDNNHFTLPRIGTLKLWEKAKKLRWLISEGGKITQATIKYEQNKWFVSINVKTDDTLALKYFNSRSKRKLNRSIIGIDVGLKVFLTASDGTTIENPKYLRKSLEKIRKINKRLARKRSLDKRTGEVASNRWKKTYAQITKSHAKVANQRKDFLHKLSNQLVNDYELIGIEDINVQGLVKHRQMALSISDVGWAEFKRQLKYKSKWYGCKILEMDRFYPSSKTCSQCGVVKAKLSLAERTYRCDKCGLVIDRDLNAALNIKAVAYSWWETLNERGEESSDLSTEINVTDLVEALRDKKSQVIQD